VRVPDGFNRDAEAEGDDFGCAAGKVEPIEIIAIEVPTRQAAIACIVRLPGRWVGVRPVAHEYASMTMQTAIQAQVAQANNKAP
jgi:hypothetical protein